MVNARSTVEGSSTYEKIGRLMGGPTGQFLGAV